MRWGGCGNLADDTQAHLNLQESNITTFWIEVKFETLLITFASSSLSEGERFIEVSDTISTISTISLSEHHTHGNVFSARECSLRDGTYLFRPRLSLLSCGVCGSLASTRPFVQAFGSTFNRSHQPQLHSLRTCLATRRATPGATFPRMLKSLRRFRASWRGREVPIEDF